jgi:hypothetical protein
MPPPPERRRDASSPAAGHHGPGTDLLTAVDAWCRRALHRARQLPHLHDDVDDIAVQRACDGDRSIVLNRAEMHAAWQLLERRGLSAYRIGPILGVSWRTVVRWRQGHHRPLPRRTVGPLAARRGLVA